MRRIGTMAVEDPSRTHVIMLTPQRLAGVAVLRMDEGGQDRPHILNQETHDGSTAETIMKSVRIQAQEGYKGN